MGQSIDAVVNAASPGDIVRIHSGSYPRVEITKSFVREIVIEGEPGVTVEGFTISGAGVRIQQLATTGENLIESGAHDVVFDRVTASAPTGSYLGPSCWYIRAARRVTIQDSSGRGGWDVIKVYAPPPELAREIVVRGNDLSGARQDIIHVDGAVAMTVVRNQIHDPIDNADHNDGIQSQHSAQLKIVRNTFTWSSRDPGGGPNQAIMLGNVPELWADRKVVGTDVVGNLVHHWNGGRPLIVNGTENTRIVNNTFQDSGDGVSVTVTHQGSLGGQNPGLEIWNNILESVYLDRGATRPSLFSTNLIAKGYRGMNGTRAITADPKFVTGSSYRLSRQSPARGRGLSRAGTPSLELDGSKRSTPPDLGVW